MTTFSVDILKIIDYDCMFSVSVPIWYMFLAGRPYNRGFYCDDPSIQYPYKPDTISTTVLVISGFTIAKFVVIIHFYYFLQTY